MAKNNNKTLFLVQTALMTAIIIVLAFTPLGYAIKIGALAVTLIILPVAVGASISGVKSGAILGTVFGITSFAQCLGGDFLGALAFSISPVLCFIMCIITRLIAGAAAGAVSTGLKNIKAQPVRYALTGLTASLLNSVLFLSSLYFFFGSKMMQDQSFTEALEADGTSTFFALIIAPAIVNVIAEAVINSSLTAVIMTALRKSGLVKE